MALWAEHTHRHTHTGLQRVTETNTHGDNINPAQWNQESHGGKPRFTVDDFPWKTCQNPFTSPSIYLHTHRHTHTKPKGCNQGNVLANLLCSGSPKGGRVMTHYHKTRGHERTLPHGQRGRVVRIDTDKKRKAGSTTREGWNDVASLVATFGCGGNWFIMRVFAGEKPGGRFRSERPGLWRF